MVCMSHQRPGLLNGKLELSAYSIQYVWFELDRWQRDPIPGASHPKLWTIGTAVYQKTSQSF